MSVLARQRLGGRRVSITRPTPQLLADGSRARVGLVDGTAPDGVVVRADEKVRFASLTTARREQVFGVHLQATDTIRVPIGWALQEGDQLTTLDGADVGVRYRIEKVIAYRTRPRITHAECAIVQLPTGAR